MAGYFRVSQARDEMSAPELYREEIECYCRYKALILGALFSDVDCSGWRGSKKRPGLEALEHQRRQFSRSLSLGCPASGRSMSELVQLFDLFDSDGISLVFLDMNIDTSTSQGRLLRHVMAAAEYESDVKADYARMTYRHVVTEGRLWGGRVPLGYKRVNKHYEVEPEGRHFLSGDFKPREPLTGATMLNELVKKRSEAVEEPRPPGFKGCLWKS